MADKAQHRFLHTILQLIANDCYKMEHYFYSAKSFDVLERLDPSPEYWDGKSGACIGILKQITLGTEPKESLRVVANLLRNSVNPQVEYILRLVKKVAKELGVSL